MRKLLLVLIVFCNGIILNAQSTDPAGCVFEGSLYSDSSEVVIGLPFVLWIRDNGTGCQLAVQYATQTGNPFPAKPAINIRLLDDYNDIIDQAGAGVVEFTQNSVEFAVNRTWVEAVYEGSSGGAVIVIRDGRTRFLTDESYAIIRARFIVCPPTFPPSYLIDADNGLYVANDTTVRMGGFLIEPTTIETNAFNWQMIDTLSSQQFGLTYDSPINGDTSAYFARRWGPWRQVMEMGRTRWLHQIKDTTGGDWSQISQGITNGTPIPYFIIESSNSAGTQLSQLAIQKNFASWTMIDPFNPNYTIGFQMNSSTISIGANDANGPGNGPSIGAYAFGSNHYVFLKTDDVDNGTASVGQFLQLKNLGTGEVEFATIDLSGYLEIADTAAMLLNYPSTAGYGIIDAGKTWRADTTSPNGLATRFFAKTLPTSILTGQVAYSNGVNLVGSPNHFWDNANARLGIFNTSPTYTIDATNNNNGAALFRITNSSTGNAAFTGTYYQMGGAYGLTAKLSTGYTSYKTQRAGDLTLYNNGSGGNISLLNDHTSGTINFSAGGTSTAQMTLATTGNLLLGTTTDVPQSILTAGGVTKGSLPFPRGTTAERNAITGVAHLNFGNTSTNTTDVYDAVAGAWTSYGRLNATQTWTGTNTFSANGGNNATYWNSANTSFPGVVLGARSVRNTPKTGDFQSIGIGAGSAIGWNGAEMMLWGGTLGRIGFYGNTNSGEFMAIEGALISVTSNTGEIGFTPNRNIFNPLVTSGNIRNMSITPTISIFSPNTIINTNWYYNPTFTGNAPGTHRFVETVTGDWYVGSTSGVMGIRTAPDPVYELKVGGDFISQDTIFNTNPPTHATQSGLAVWLSTAQGYALGKVALGANLRYLAGVLSATWGSGGGNSILDSLGNGSIVIDASGNDLEFDNLDSLRFTTAGGDEISLNDTEFTVLGLVNAKQESYYEITSTTSPQTLSSDYSDNLVNQGGTQASFTFMFPATPTDGQILTLTWNNAISTLTLDGNGNTITGTAVTTAVAGTQRKFKFYTATGTWIKIY